MTIRKPKHKPGARVPRASTAEEPAPDPWPKNTKPSTVTGFPQIARHFAFRALKGMGAVLALAILAAGVVLLVHFLFPR